MIQDVFIVEKRRVSYTRRVRGAGLVRATLHFHREKVQGLTTFL